MSAELVIGAPLDPTLEGLDLSGDTFEGQLGASKRTGSFKEMRCSFLLAALLESTVALWSGERSCFRLQVVTSQRNTAQQKSQQSMGKQGVCRKLDSLAMTRKWLILHSVGRRSAKSHAPFSCRCVCVWLYTVAITCALVWRGVHVLDHMLCATSSCLIHRNNTNFTFFGL